MEFTNVMVCTDCYWVHHFGYIDEDIENTPDGEERQLRSHGAYLEMGGDRYVSDNTDSETGEGIRTFSSQPCECCGSHLGGSRYRLAVEVH